MPDLFALAMPWWEFILRAVVVYAVVLGMVRLSGKRALGQVTPFDVLLIVLLGNAVQNALLGTDTSLAGGLLLAATLILLNYGVGWITARSRRAGTADRGRTGGDRAQRQALRQRAAARAGQPRRFRGRHAPAELYRRGRGGTGAAGNQRPHHHHSPSARTIEARHSVGRRQHSSGPRAYGSLFGRLRLHALAQSRVASMSQAT